MKSFISRRDRIIISAIDIINELGIQKLSTKEIAARQGVNESALYRHFKNKDAILEGVIEYYSQFDEAIYNSIIKRELSVKDKILEYVKAYLEYYEGYPAITAIALLYETLSHEMPAKEKLRIAFDTRVKNLIAIIEESQCAGEINSIFTAKKLVYMIMGYCNEIILYWRRDGFNDSFKEDTLNTLNKLLSIIFEKNK